MRLYSRLQTREGKRGTVKNASVENARREMVEPYDRGGKSGTGKGGIRLQGWKPRNWKTRRQCVGCGKRGNEFYGTPKIQERT